MIKENLLHRIVQSKNDWLAQSFLIYLNHEKSLQALSNYGRMEAVELEKEIDYEIS